MLSVQSIFQHIGCGICQMSILMLVVFQWEAKKVRASGVKSYPLYRKPQVFSQFIAAPDASQKACLTRQPLIRFSDRYKKRQCEQPILKFLHEQAVKKNLRSHEFHSILIQYGSKCKAKSRDAVSHPCRTEAIGREYYCLILYFVKPHCAFPLCKFHTFGDHTSKTRM